MLLFLVIHVRFIFTENLVILKYLLAVVIVGRKTAVKIGAEGGVD